MRVRILPLLALLFCIPAAVMAAEAVSPSDEAKDLVINHDQATADQSDLNLDTATDEWRGRGWGRGWGRGGWGGWGGWGYGGWGGYGYGYGLGYYGLGYPYYSAYYAYPYYTGLYW